MTKTGRQLDREINEALQTYRQQRKRPLHHSTIIDKTSAKYEPTSDELYAVAYDILREYEQHWKLMKEKSPEAQNLLTRLQLIREEIDQLYPKAKAPEPFIRLHDRLMSKRSIPGIGAWKMAGSKKHSFRYRLPEGEYRVDPIEQDGHTKYLLKFAPTEGPLRDLGEHDSPNFAAGTAYKHYKDFTQ